MTLPIPTKQVSELDPVTSAALTDLTAVYQDSTSKLKYATLAILQRLMLQVPFKIIAVADSPYTVLNTDYIIELNTADGDITVVLDTDLLIAGKRYLFKKVSASNTASITTEGSETIEGSASQDLTSNNETLYIYSDGSNWKIGAGSAV